MWKLEKEKLTIAQMEYVLSSCMLKMLLANLQVLRLNQGYSTYVFVHIEKYCCWKHVFAHLDRLPHMEDAGEAQRVA
eukprot:9774716-Heterocapsa_arctica.AAC.1